MPDVVRNVPKKPTTRVCVPSNSWPCRPEGEGRGDAARHEVRGREGEETDRTERIDGDGVRWNGRGSDRTGQKNRPDVDQSDVKRGARRECEFVRRVWELYGFMRYVEDASVGDGMGWITN